MWLSLLTHRSSSSTTATEQSKAHCITFFQHVDEENCYLCGYLKITGLTSEFPTLTTFFDAEIISKKYPFLTRKWDADEEVDRKHWVSCCYQSKYLDNPPFELVIADTLSFFAYFLGPI